MAYDDTLFQLGMDLTRSSTAQKEDHGEIALVAPALGTFPGYEMQEGRQALTHADRKDFFIERDGVKFAGTHLLVDLFGASRLDDIAHIEKTLKRCVEVAGATLLHIHLHHFTPNGGVSGVAVLSESHISIHSWPEANYAALDIFMCGEARPHLAIEVLRAEFGAKDVVVKEHLRGEELAELQWKAAGAKKAPIRMKKVRRAA